MNSNPTLNREITTLWHGKAKTAERKDVVKEKRQSLYTHETIDFVTLLDTEQHQHYDNKNISKILHL